MTDLTTRLRTRLIADSARRDLVAHARPAFPRTPYHAALAAARQLIDAS